VQRAEELKEAMAERAARGRGCRANDPEFQQRLQEIAEQLDRALTPEMREALEELRRAVSATPPGRKRRWSRWRGAAAAPRGAGAEP
jgi:hypothetical protein